MGQAIIYNNIILLIYSLYMHKLRNINGPSEINSSCWIFFFSPFMFEQNLFPVVTFVPLALAETKMYQHNTNFLLRKKQKKTKKRKEKGTILRTELYDTGQRGIKKRKGTILRLQDENPVQRA
ncbi:hypothetical protein LguiA_024230 [Lonicera macranthoides]